jgi:hypothetical protein
MARAVPFAVALPDDLSRQLDAAAAEQGVSRGVVIREALRAELARRAWGEIESCGDRDEARRRCRVTTTLRSMRWNAVWSARSSPWCARTGRPRMSTPKPPRHDYRYKFQRELEQAISEVRDKSLLPRAHEIVLTALGAIREQGHGAHLDFQCASPANVRRRVVASEADTRILTVFRTGSTQRSRAWCTIVTSFSR